jgi:hypothetical protein
MLPGGGAAGHRKHHCGGGSSSSSSTVGDEDDNDVSGADGGEFEEEAEYDETMERWQYVKISIKGMNLSKAYMFVFNQSCFSFPFFVGYLATIKKCFFLAFSLFY